MVTLDLGLGNFFTTFWQVFTDFFLLIFVILYAIAFFVIQYYLIKGYIWLIKSVIDKIPFVNDFISQKFFDTSNNKNNNSEQN